MRALRRLLTRAPEADETQIRSKELVAERAARGETLYPAAFAKGAIRAKDVLAQRHHHADDVLGHGDLRAFGIDDARALRQRRAIDILGACGRAQQQSKLTARPAHRRVENVCEDDVGTGELAIPGVCILPINDDQRDRRVEPRTKLVDPVLDERHDLHGVTSA